QAGDIPSMVSRHPVHYRGVGPLLSSLYRGTNSKPRLLQGSAWVSVLEIVRAVTRLGSPVEPTFILITERRSGGGEQLNAQSTRNEGQKAYGHIHHSQP